MKTKKSLKYIILCFCTISQSASLVSAQTAEIDVPSIIVAETSPAKFEVPIIFKDADITLTANDAPKIEGCTFISGPAISSAFHYETKSGTATNTQTKTFTFSYLLNDIHDIAIPAMTFYYDGKELQTPPVYIMVTSSDKENKKGMFPGVNLKGKNKLSKKTK